MCTVGGITYEVATLASGNLHKIVLFLSNNTPSTAVKLGLAAATLMLLTGLFMPNVPALSILTSDDGIEIATRFAHNSTLESLRYVTPSGICNEVSELTLKNA